jgi:hypothetical protein
VAVHIIEETASTSSQMTGAKKCIQNFGGDFIEVWPVATTRSFRLLSFWNLCGLPKVRKHKFRKLGLFPFSGEERETPIQLGRLERLRER